MDQLIGMLGQFIMAHPHWAIVALVGSWVLSNVVSAMPSPDQGSGKGYKFLFTLGHGMMGSLGRVIPWLRLPSDPSRKDPSFFGKPDATGGQSIAQPPTPPEAPKP